jgi:4-hydroxybenzoate polyprenyltransferase
MLKWAEMIKIEHTVFALPFALSGLILASPTLPSWRVVLWTVLAFCGARSAAMTINRIVDSEFDARNPRTNQRALVKKTITKQSAFLFACFSFGLMIYAASHLPPICLWLSPIAVFWLSFYSYTKRFTWLCHLCLGIALGGAALGGWIAASGSLASLSPWLLALAVATWVTGFDIIYACQDFAIDRREKLHSIPARFGLSTALFISRALHMVTILSFILLGINLHLHIWFWLGSALITSTLIYEHNLVRPDDLSKVNAAFFNVNGILSILAFVAILTDKLFQ